jgi:HEAT repeat protein
LLTLLLPNASLGQPAVRPIEQKARVEKLRSILKDGDRNAKIKACESLRAEGPAAIAATPELFDLLLHPGKGDLADKCREAVCQVFHAIGSDAVPCLIDRFKAEKTSEERFELLCVLAALNERRDARINQILCRTLHDSDPTIRLSAVSFVALPYPIKQAIPLLMEIASDEKADASFRGAAAVCLGEFGEDARVAIGTEMGIVQNRKSDSMLRIQALRGLRSIGHCTPETAALLLQRVSDDDEESDVRVTSVEVFDGDKLARQRAAPDLIAILKKRGKATDQDVRCAILWALGNSKLSPDALPVLLEFIDDEEAIAAAALRAVATIGPDAKTAIPKIVDAINRGCKVREAISSGVRHNPDKWEPILLGSLGRERSAALMRHFIEVEGDDSGRFRKMLDRLQPR